MSTSGTYRALEDVDRTHDCGWEGDVLAVRDDEDRTLWWQCPGCSATVTEHHDDDYDRGASDVLFTLIIAGAALFTIGALGGSWPLILGGVWLVAAILTIATVIGGKQKDNHS